MNSFAMIFGHCVWIPPSPKAALVALNLFFGIGTTTQPDITAAEAIIAAQYVAGGKTQVEAQKEVAWLNACFGSYEVPPENRNHPEDAKLTPLRKAGADRQIDDEFRQYAVIFTATDAGSAKVPRHRAKIATSADRIMSPRRSPGAGPTGKARGARGCAKAARSVTTAG